MARFTVEIDTDNDAFGTADYGQELARILEGVADYIADGDGVESSRRSVRDVNGNTVGSFGWAGMDILDLTPGEAFELASALNDTERGARIGFEDGTVKVSIDRDVWTVGYGTAAE